MSDKHPQPGDTIEVTRSSSYWLGRRLIVVECPKSYKKSFWCHPSYAWVYDTTVGEPSFFMPDSYKIVARRNGQSSTTNSDIDESLRQQLDKNLRAVFT